ncbi:ArnT family glycosyltransferase [Rhodanobacter koreensis]
MPTTDLACRQSWQWRFLILFIGLLALGFRYYYVTHAEVFQPVNQPNVRADAVEYYAYARNLVRHGVFSKAPEGVAPLVGDSYRDPGYPVFLAGWMKLFSQWDSWYAAVLLAQAVLGALTVVFMLCLGRRWMPMRWLAVAGVLMTVWPHSVAMCSYLLSETLFGFLLALGLLLLGMALERRSVGWAAASGIALSLAALTNAILLPLAFLLAVYLCVRRQMSISMSAGLIIAALLMIAPWAIRNSLLPANDATSSGRALTNLVQGSWPGYHGAYQAAMKHDPDGIIVMAAIDREIATIEPHPLAGLDLIGRRVAEDPGHYIRWYLSKPALLWEWDIRMGQGDVYVYPTRNSPFKVSPIYRAVGAISHSLNPWLFALAMIGGVLALMPRHKIQPSIAATALTLALVTVVYSVLQAEPRYAIPFRGAEIMLAVFVACRGIHAITQLRAWPRAKPAHM